MRRAPLRRSQRLATLALAAGLVVAACGVTSPAADPEPASRPSALVAVGPGVAESAQRQIARTADGRVYIASVDDDSLNDGAYAVLHMYRARETGIPSGFDVQDAASETRVTRPATLSGGDMRLDPEGVLHLTYFRTDTRQVLYRTFSTRTDTWGAPQEVVRLAGETEGARGKVVSNIGLDAAGRLLVAVAGSTGVRAFVPAPDGWRQEWSHSAKAVHPSLAFDTRGQAHLAWYQDARLIRYAVRAADGGWSEPESIASGDVLDNSNLDQSPSLAFDAADRPVVLYLDADQHVRTVALGEDGWRNDDPAGVYAHTPGLHLRGDDRLVALGHDRDIHPAYLSRAAGASWSSVVVFPPPAEPGNFRYDGSASVRFDPLHETDCTTVDIAFFDEDRLEDRSFHPTLYYGAVRLPALPGGCPPSAAVPAAAGARAASCRVPELKGRTLRGARRRLARANCRVGDVRRRGKARLRVVSQSPRARTVRKRNARVAITLRPRAPR